MNDAEVRVAAELAMDAFWTSVAKSFSPRIDSGDFPPSLDRALRGRAEYCIRMWLSINSDQEGETT